MTVAVNIANATAAAFIASIGFLLVVCALFWLARATGWSIEEAVRRMSRRRRVTVAIAVFAAALYGGGKHSIFRFDVGLADNGSYGTNDLVSVSWLYDDFLALDTIYIDYRETGTTNNWERLWQGPVSDGHVSGYVPGATNYTFYAWTAYVPPDAVVTNGVYHISGVMHPMDDANTNAWIVPATPVRADGETLTPQDIAP